MRGESYIGQPKEEVKAKGAGRAYLNKKEKFVLHTELPSNAGHNDMWSQGPYAG